MPKPALIFAEIGFAVAAFIVAVSLGSAVTATTGIPLAGGLLNGVLTAMILTIGVLAAPFVGNATLLWVVFAAAASLTTTLGPPGIYKIVIGLTAGLIWDLFYHGSRRKTWGLYVGAVLGAASIMFTLVLALQLGFGQNAEESLNKYLDALWILVPINMTVTVIGVYLGQSVYRKRLSKLPTFANLKRFDNNPNT